MLNTSLPCPRCRTPLPPDMLRQGGLIHCPQCDSQLVLQDSSPNSLAWYFARDNQDQVGPFSWLQLRQLASQGMLLPTDRLWRAGLSTGAAAGAFPGLFQPAPSGSKSSADRDTAVPPAADSGGAPDASAAPTRVWTGPRPTAEERPLPRAAVALADFEILKKLGAGAMGVVHLARQRTDNRLVALKVLSRALAEQPDFVQRFFREAEVMSRLHHPHIVEFCAVGEENGQYYFAMEFIDGFTLATLLQGRGGRLPIADALHITIAAARALAYAHERNVVHRDVKPANIMITRLGRVKLTDLGLARPVDADLSLTTSGASIGTPYYMAPEQAHHAELADPRSDIYGLGGVLYQMLTGKLPFEGDSALALMLAKDRGQFPSVRRFHHAVPDRLALMIDRMLAKEPRLRYQSCLELVQDLENLKLAGEHLSFNPLHGASPPPEGADGTVQVLLVEDDPADVLMARDAVEKNAVPAGLTVASSPAEALNFLRRQGDHAGAPRPDLIFLGRDLLQRGGLEVLAAVQGDAALRDIPVIVLTTAVDAAERIAAHGVEVGLTFEEAADLERLDAHLHGSAGGSSVVLVRLPTSAG